MGAAYAEKLFGRIGKRNHRALRRVGRRLGRQAFDASTRFGKHYVASSCDGRRDRNGPSATGFWSLLISSLIEGLALYGASVHSMGFFPPPPDEPLSSAPRDIAVRRWRGPIRVVSSTGPQDAASTRVDRDVARLAQVDPRSASEGRREREIQKAAAALARFDDRTLLGLGIPHRSYIEQTVRFCHDC